MKSGWRKQQLKNSFQPAQLYYPDFKWCIIHCYISLIFCWLRLSHLSLLQQNTTSALFSTEPQICATLCLIAVSGPFCRSLIGCICMWEHSSTAAQIYMHIPDPIFMSGSCLIYWQCFKRLQPWYSSQITQILNHCLNLWSPATRFLESRHGNLKSGLPWGNRDVRCENDFKELKKQWFGPLLCTVCVEF